MIRHVLIALGLSAGGLGAANAQGMVATAPILEACGGTTMVLTPQSDVDEPALVAASDVVSARVGGAFGQVFDYTQVVGGTIVVSLPAGLASDPSAIDPLIERVAFGFHEVVARAGRNGAVTTGAGQILLPDSNDPDVSYVVVATPVLDGTHVASAQLGFDYNNQPAVSFQFTPEGGDIFGQFTGENIGNPFAIVLQGEVMSAPVIQARIDGGSGIITGLFTVAEVEALANVLQGGVLPFDLAVTAQEIMDGSDPSADFCP